MKSPPLIAVLFTAAFLSAHSQILSPGYYWGTVSQMPAVGIHLNVESNGAIGIVVGRINQITGGVSALAAGVATNKSNGVIVGRLSGRGRLRGHISEDGQSVSGRLIMLKGDRNLWFAHRFEVRLAETNQTGGSVSSWVRIRRVREGTNTGRVGEGTNTVHIGGATFTNLSPGAVLLRFRNVDN